MDLFRWLKRCLGISLVWSAMGLGLLSQAQALPSSVSLQPSPGVLAPSAQVPQPTSPRLSSPYEKLAHAGYLRHTGSVGVMQQALQPDQPWFWSSYLGAPFFAGGLIVLMGNAAILSTDGYDDSTYLAWGITGVVWGTLGGAASIVSMILDLANAAKVTPNPTGNLIAFGVINTALQLTCLGLGIASIVRGKSNQDPARVAWAPWVQPDRQGNVQVGLLLHGTF